jgi:diguanylate cyclase (GGDEF)-like protein/PAS domain S-box-containing protein
MQSAPQRTDEVATLKALHELAVLDSAPEAEFDALARLASVMCGTPIALISLVDADRQWFKASVGLSATQTPRDISFCGHAVLGESVFEVTDASQDVRFADNPLVTGYPHVRYYAGAPVRLSDGLCVGTICVVDQAPSRLSETQSKALQWLAIAVARALEGRYAIRTALKSAAACGLAEFEGSAGDCQVRTVVAELAQQHEVLRVALRSISDAVIAADAQANVVWLNPVAEQLTGWTSLEAKGQPAAKILPTVDVECRVPIDCLLNERVLAEDCEPPRRSLLLSRSGRELLIESNAEPICTDSSGLPGVVLVFRDVSESSRVSRELSHQATHEPLTGLYNRAEFERLLERALIDARRDSDEHALLFIDLDQLRVVNDACGHPAGDRVLREVAQLLSCAVRATDAVARIGGDEFAVILRQCNPCQAQAVAQKICDRLDDYRFAHDQQRFRIGASIGLVPVDQRWATTALVMQAAEASCFAATEAGGGRVYAWREADEQIDVRHGEMQWATRIERALDEDRFVLFAQRIEPIGKPGVGLHAEVLIRKVGSDGKLIPPGAFLPAAERFHLATRIDRWVLKRVIACLKALPSLGPVENLSVNLSGQSVGDPSFQRWVLDMLCEAGSTVCRTLCLEITETSAVTNMAVAVGFIAKVREAGVRVALDDFGVGVSSFGYLKNFQIDYLKIDGQFIRELLTDPLNDAAVRCFVDVAKVIGVKTVAEFVDQPAVFARLGELGVDFAQGYLLHRPAPLDELFGESAKSSVERIESGTVVVAQAEVTMRDIVTNAENNKALMADISKASAGQTSGLRHVEESIHHLDGASQQNGPLVEQTAAAAAALKDNSSRMNRDMAYFKLP